MNIQKRPDGKWRARYRDENGKEHAKHFARKVDAQAWLDQVTSAVVTGQYVDPKAGKVSLRTYAATWEASQLGSEATTRLNDNALRVHILPVLGDRPMGSIQPSEVQGLVKNLSVELAPSSVHNIYDVVARLFRAAVHDRVRPESPCRNINLPRRSKEEVVPPTVKEVTKIMGAIADRYQAVPLLLAGSGLRIGELLGLRVSDVDFLRRSVRIERQRLQTGDLGPTKGRKARTVPLGQVVLDGLAVHLAAHPSREWLFVTKAGRPLTYQVWLAQWTLACDAAGVTTKTHHLRHFFASALITGGASVKQVQAALGHDNATTTLRTYAHLWPGDEDRTRDAIDKTLKSLRTDCGPGVVDEEEKPGQMG